MFVRFEDMRVIRDENYKKVPLQCDVCGNMMTKHDINDYKKYECCSYCSLFFAQPNEKKWASGWRPSKKERKRVFKIREKEPIYTMRGL